VDLTDLRRTAGRLLTITLPAALLVTLLLMLAVEAWVRVTAKARSESPGLFVPDPVRGMRLAPNYSGWFAGVPVHTNSLGLREDRELPPAKAPNTFRILVLGDSVTFGHGSIAEHTYPRLLEDMLRAWRPDIAWEVWNAAVPGYNTSQELAQLVELGPIVKPDLVIVGFYENDLIDNFDVRPPDTRAVLATKLRAAVQAHVYSFDLYRRLFLTMRWNLSASDAYRRRLEALDDEHKLMARPSQIVDADLQQLRPYARLTDDDVRALKCREGQRPDPTLAAAIQSSADWPRWTAAVHELQRLHAVGRYRVVFFLNMIPLVCPDGDFYDGAIRIENDLFMQVVSEGTPAVSVFDAFLHRRPSQMPYAQAHAIGNSNATKAETLLAYLKDQRLVPQP
jgi:lysophospholipase L1-like esterase